jgi:colicin import membrane protein
MPIAIVTGGDISQAPRGQQNAPKTEKPKPLVDKLGEEEPVTQIAPKVANKPEITTDSLPPQPKPEPKPPEKTEKPESKPVEKAEAKPTEKAQTPKRPDEKPDQIAEQLKKDEAKKPPKPEKKEPQFRPDQIAEQLKRDENKKPPTKFDAHQVAALLDKREPQRHVATGETLSNAGSLGAANGHDAQLSQSELDAFRARLIQCWSPPPGLDPDSKVYVVLRVTFKPDGSLAREPAVVENTAAASLGPALAESGKRALMLCQPFTMLRPEHYDLWKDGLEPKFNNEMLGR